MHESAYKQKFTTCGLTDDEEKRFPAKALEAGEKAPEFTLYSTPEQTVSLSEFRGQRVILAFYPADWSPV